MFCWKNVRSFGSTKASLICQQKIQCIWFKVQKHLTSWPLNELVKLTMPELLGPRLYFWTNCHFCRKKCEELLQCIFVHDTSRPGPYNFSHEIFISSCSGFNECSTNDFVELRLLWSAGHVQGFSCLYGNTVGRFAWFQQTPWTTGETVLRAMLNLHRISIDSLAWSWINVHSMLFRVSALWWQCGIS